MQPPIPKAGLMEVKLRRHNRALLLSLGLHTGAIAYFTGASVERPPAPPRPAGGAAPEIHTIELITVAERVEPPTNNDDGSSGTADVSPGRGGETEGVGSPEPAPSRPSRPPPSVGEKRVRHPSESAVSAAIPGDATRMRSPESSSTRIDLFPGPGSIEAPPAPAIDPLGLGPRKSRPVSPELSPSGGGTFRTDDSAFVAHTAADGRVRIVDRPAASVELALPTPAELGRELEAWAKDPYAYAMGEHDPERKTVPIIRGRTELTDFVMRLGGEDPYWAKKLQFLDRTRPARANLAARARRDRLQESVVETGAALRMLWRRADLSARAKRRILFELWDECAERGDSEVLRSARAVRASIIGFIRRELPEASAGAYPPEELEELNGARSSRSRFAPY